MDIWIKQLILKVIHSIVPSSGLGEKLFVPILKLGREYFSNFNFEKSEDFHAWAFLDLYRHLFTFFTFSILEISIASLFVVLKFLEVNLFKV